MDELRHPNLFFTVVLPIAVIVIGGLIALALATRPRASESPHNPGGDPWDQH